MYYNIYIVFLRADIVPLDDNTGIVEFVSVIAKRLAIVCRPAGEGDSYLAAHVCKTR